MRIDRIQTRRDHIGKPLALAGQATSSQTTVYDLTCGSGLLLLKVADQAGTAVTLYGQEKDTATSGLPA